ncbi:MAG: hypothetical protein ACOC6E_02365 [Thermodesulfobacteriota bacterium]
MADDKPHSQAAPYPRDVTEIAHLLSQSLDKDFIIQRVLVHINRRLGKRARYCVYKDSKLVIQSCVGEYSEYVEPGREIVRESVVWNVFKRGEPVNFVHPSQSNGHQHTLKDQVKIKAAVPLSYVDPRTQRAVKFGILVIDSGKKGTPITEDEFAYLLVMADLMAETIGKAKLVDELLESYEKRREMIITMTDYLRNRFMAIGGFARRLHKRLRSREEKYEAMIISKEIEQLEERLKTIEEMFKEEEKRIGHPQPEEE